MHTSQARQHAHTRLRSVAGQRWEFHYTAISDVGRKREANEDYYLLHPDRQLFVIADGMGGHSSGEVASRMTCETVAAYFDEADLPRRLGPETGLQQSLQQHLVQAIKIANASVFQEAVENPARQGMGTTVVALTFCGDHAYWGHVGDSRLYRLRTDDLQPLTRDHSLLEQTLDRQDFTEEESAQFTENFPYKNVLTRAVGSRYVVDVDVDSAPLQNGDLFIMTTDGVHDVLGVDKLGELLVQHRPDWNDGCQAIVAETNHLGGPDNITALCVEVRSR